MNGRAYYNENDAFAAQWLRNLIAAGLIAPGDVDERSIVDVKPDDVRGYTQCHLFAGIGGWSYALRLAGWPDDRECWTGSCPCQPLSGAGRRKGHADDRHLWPAFHRLIADCSPSIVFGEQVASKDGREWLAGIRADLEDLGYACGSADLCAAGVGAPHPRQRLYCWPTLIKRDGATLLRARRAPNATGSEPMAWVGGLVTGLVTENRAGLQMEVSVGLNPAWASWLMGFPAEWPQLAPSATRSSRKSQRNSSSRRKKQSEPRHDES